MSHHLKLIIIKLSGIHLFIELELNDDPRQ